MAEENLRKTREIYRLIPLIMKEVGGIEKTRKNKQGEGYLFRGIDDFLLVLQPAFIKYGMFVVPTVLERKIEERASKSGGVLTFTRLHVEYRFYAPDGSSVTAVTVGEAMDSSDKSSNKAMSAALKYALTQVFCVPTKEPKDTEEDNHEITPISPPVSSINNSATVRFISDAQRKRLFAIAGYAGWNDKDVKALVKRVTGQESTKEIPWTSYDQIWKEIERSAEPREPGDDRGSTTELD